MNLLLDTHIFIWWVTASHKLSPTVHSALKNPDHTLILSVASVWEMQIKANSGRILFPLPVKEFVTLESANRNIQMLPVIESHVWALKALPFIHRDPFDRLLAAQTIVEQYKLVTADRSLIQYPISLLT